MHDIGVSVVTSRPSECALMKNGVYVKLDSTLDFFIFRREYGDYIKKTIQPMDHDKDVKGGWYIDSGDGWTPIISTSDGYNLYYDSEDDVVYKIPKDIVGKMSLLQLKSYDLKSDTEKTTKWENVIHE